MLLMLTLTFIFSNFWSPMKNYSKVCIHSHKLMLLFSEMMLFSSRDTMFDCYSTKILCVYPDHRYLQNIDLYVHICVQSTISNKSSTN